MHGSTAGGLEIDLELVDNNANDIVRRFLFFIARIDGYPAFPHVRAKVVASRLAEADVAARRLRKIGSAERVESVFGRKEGILEHR